MLPIDLFSHLVTLVWIIPAITQRRSKYKFYFLITSICSLLSFCCFLLFAYFSLNVFWMMNYLYLFITFALPISLIDIRTISNWKYWLILYFVLALILSLAPKYLYGSTLYTKQLEITILFLMHLIIFGVLVRMLFNDVLHLLKIDAFSIILILYQFTTAVRFFFDVAGTRIGQNNELLLLKFHTFLGLFFWFFKENNKILIYKIKEKTQVNE